MQTRSSLRLLVGLCLLFGGLSLAATFAPTSSDGPPQEPRAIALAAWKSHLQNIGWPEQLRNRIAPRFLGKQKSSVANEHGGMTVTFDGSRPGLRATVTVVLDADGKPVVAPVVELADIVEAR